MSVIPRSVTWKRALSWSGWTPAVKPSGRLQRLSITTRRSVSGVGQWDFDARHRRVSVLVHMLGEHSRVVHLVDVIGRQEAPAVLDVTDQALGLVLRELLQPGAAPPGEYQRERAPCQATGPLTPSLQTWSARRR